MVAVSRYSVGGLLLALSLVIGCDRSPVDPSTPLFRTTEPPWSASAVAASEARIDVGWADVTLYEIRRLSENTTSFRVSEFDFGLSDTYFVAATRSSGYSDFSNAAVLTAAPVPVARRVQAAGGNKH